MQYIKPYILTEKVGNNAFAWEERRSKYNKNPSLTIPSCIIGNIGDVQIGEEIVFEEMEDGKLRSCKGLKNFVRITTTRKKGSFFGSSSSYKFGISVDEIFEKIAMFLNFAILENKSKTDNKMKYGRFRKLLLLLVTKVRRIYLKKEDILLSGDQKGSFLRQDEKKIHENPVDTFSTKTTEEIILETPEIIIFDNHNHALYFWCEAIQRGILESQFELIHIDEHSDLWENQNELDPNQSITNLEYTWNFTNFSCNVGNYIQPAIKYGLIKSMIRIENEYQIDAYMNYIPDTNSILNIDLDIFAPELDHIPESKKIQVIRNLIQKVKYVTIATSPYFIEQGKALQMLEKILQKQG